MIDLRHYDEWPMGSEAPDDLDPFEGVGDDWTTPRDGEELDECEG